MATKNGIKYVDIETVKSMYMMVKHVHDMYMSCHALIVNPSCTCYVYVRQICTCTEQFDTQHVEHQITPSCTCLYKIQKKIALVIPTLQKRIVLQLLDTGETGAANRPPIMFLFFMLKYNILFRIAKVRKNDENPNIFHEKQSISLKNSNPAYHAF